MCNCPILGNPTYCYSDESGDKDPNQRDSCFCFAIISFLYDGNAKIEHEKEKILRKRRRPSIKDLEKTNKILIKYQAYVNVVYYDFSDEKSYKGLIAKYQKDKNSTKLESNKIPTLSNYIWLKSYGVAILETIFNIIKSKEEVRNIFLKYHTYSFKNREREIIEKQAKKWITERLQGVSKRVNEEAARKYMKGEEALVVDIGELSEKDIRIRIADQMARSFRYYYKENKIEEFKSIFKYNKLFVSDLTKCL